MKPNRTDKPRIECLLEITYTNLCIRSFVRLFFPINYEMNSDFNTKLVELCNYWKTIANYRNETDDHTSHTDEPQYHRHHLDS